MRKLLFAIAAFGLVGFGLVGCGEPEQVVVYKQGKYQGKPDGRPWDSEPVAYAGTKWTKGNRESWEQAIKTRQLGQHEHKRIYQ